jgi:D-serine deaminase-like pyridoxal phosphate-dependent protein
VEAIGALMVAKRSARGARTQTINQARALVVTGPDDILLTTRARAKGQRYRMVWRRMEMPFIGASGKG